VDQSSPDFFRRTLEESLSNLDQLAFRFWISWPVPEIFAISLKLYKIGANFACFGYPISLGGGPPEFLDFAL